MNLQSKLQSSISYFFSLDVAKQYRLAFSGGKDSHALLGVYLLARQQGLQLDVDVVFSDTYLEDPILYKLIDTMFSFLAKQNVICTKVKPKETYWFSQFVYGFPVPHHHLRWCTQKLKIEPMKSKRIPLTGRHLGESTARDHSLKKSTCASSECGTDKIIKSLDPISDWTNCDVWDFLAEYESVCFPAETFNLLQQTYDLHEDAKGSLRMGCIFCPVVARSTLKRNPTTTDEALAIRDILEELARAPRLASPRIDKTGKVYSGAIHIKYRRLAWAKLPFTWLEENNYLTAVERSRIADLLKSDYCYPKTYKKEFIDAQHIKMTY
jgi:3'-phosphoadenosine 5'-phosphosulfate sulfotransferase (PAPS reductase)/FAD synthetase